MSVPTSAGGGDCEWELGLKLLQPDLDERLVDHGGCGVDAQTGRTRSADGGVSRQRGTVLLPLLLVLLLLLSVTRTPRRAECVDGVWVQMRVVEPCCESALQAPADCGVYVFSDCIQRTAGCSMDIGQCSPSNPPEELEPCLVPFFSPSTLPHSPPRSLTSAVWQHMPTARLNHAATLASSASMFLISLVLMLLVSLDASAAKERHTIKINAPATSPPHTPRTLSSTITGTSHETSSSSTPTLHYTPPYPPITLDHPPPPAALPASHPTAHSLLSLAYACYIDVSKWSGRVVTTTVCPFHNVTQHIDTTPPSHHSLGVWSHWSTTTQPHQLTQRFDDGDGCSGGSGGGSGVPRSTALHVRCHDNVSLAAVVELRRCQYTAVLYTPAACPHLPPSQPVPMDATVVQGSRTTAAAETGPVDEPADVNDLQSCIDELSATDESQRLRVACSMRWNAVRRTQSNETWEARIDETIQVRRAAYPYKQTNRQPSHPP